MGSGGVEAQAVAAEGEAFVTGKRMVAHEIAEGVPRREAEGGGLGPFVGVGDEDAAGGATERLGFDGGLGGLGGAGSGGGVEAGGSDDGGVEAQVFHPVLGERAGEGEAEIGR